MKQKHQRLTTLTTLTALVIALSLTFVTDGRTQQEGPGGEETEGCRIASMIHCNSQCAPAQNACLGMHPTWTDFCHEQYAGCYFACLDVTWCGFQAY